MRLKFGVLIVVVALMLPIAASGTSDAEFMKYALSDVRAWYVYDASAEIDWPTVYYLNDNYGCRVDIIALTTDPLFPVSNRSLPDRQLFLHTVFVDTVQTIRWTQALSGGLVERNPDIVILAGDLSSSALSSFHQFVTSYQPSSDNLFEVSKVYAAGTAGSGSINSVNLNSRALGNMYHERMSVEIPLLTPGIGIPDNRNRVPVHYQLLERNISSSQAETDFFSGMKTFRLNDLLDSLFADGPMKETMLEGATNYQGYMMEAEKADDRATAVENAITAYRELLPVSRYRSHTTALPGNPSLERYLARLEQRAEKAITHAAGLHWEGRAVLRDSPHGPRLKFTASLSNAGTVPIELASVKFLPYWNDQPTDLQTESQVINPGQSYVRDYLIDAEPSRFEAAQPESLMFASMLVLGEIPFEIYTSLPINEALPLSIKFDPDYYFADPSARTDVDRVVESLNWKAIITKPSSYDGLVHITLETPRGMFAGAYRQDIMLEDGVRQETLEIPFTLSRLFEMGLQSQTIRMSADNVVLASDTGWIRAAACRMPSSLSIAFLPDTSGALEDVLRMANATHRPLTERTLQVGDLYGYNVIVLGSGCFRMQPNLRQYKDRFEQFVREGGSLVVMGQPDDWPIGALPVSFVSTPQSLMRDDISSLLQYANVLSKPYEIDLNGLLAWYDGLRPAAPADIAPSERVLVTPEGSTLLSVSRFGSGQIIYCGLPLTDMIADLNLEAIHLFSNLMNY